MTEPGGLAFGILPRGDFGALDRLRRRVRFLQLRIEFPNADRLHCRQIRIEPARHQRLHLAERADLEHLIEALVDPAQSAFPGPPR